MTGHRRPCICRRTSAAAVRTVVGGDSDPEHTAAPAPAAAAAVQETWLHLDLLRRLLLLWIVIGTGIPVLLLLLLLTEHRLLDRTHLLLAHDLDHSVDVGRLSVRVPTQPGDQLRTLHLSVARDILLRDAVRRRMVLQETAHEPEAGS